MKRAAQVGDRAWITAGWATTCRAPRIAITENQTSIIGPNSHPTAPVPRRWSANSPIRIAIEMGTTR